jgi:dolichol-phosphate mannosyltransferase
MKPDVLVTVASAVRSSDAGFIEQFAREVTAILSAHVGYYEVLLIDNGSDDAVVKILERVLKQFPFVRVVRLSRCYEDDIVFAAALDHSLGDFVVLMDMASDPPAVVPDLIARCEAGYDAVVGVTDKKWHDSPIGRLGARVFSRLFEALTGYAVHPDGTNFVALSRRIVNSITKIRDRQRYMKHLTAYVGFNRTYLSYQPVLRDVPLRRRSLLGAVNAAVGTIVSNSTMPLRLVSLVGLAASFVSVMYSVFVLAISALRNVGVRIHAAEGWASTNMFSAVMFFLLFLMLAVLSEYVSKIMNESQQRPLYHVAYESNSSVVEAFKDRVNVV